MTTNKLGLVPALSPNESQEPNNHPTVSNRRLSSVAKNVNIEAGVTILKKRCCSKKAAMIINNEKVPVTSFNSYRRFARFDGRCRTSIQDGGINGRSEGTVSVLSCLSFKSRSRKETHIYEEA